MSPLINAETLYSKSGAHDWLVVDVRHELGDPGYGRRAYAGGHVPGAIFLHVDEDLSGTKHDANGRFRGRHPLPDRSAFARKLADVGVSPQTTLVAYDDGDSMYAARLWWLAQWVGHDRVVVLDGGLNAWRSRGYDTSTDVPAPRTAAAVAAAGPQVATIDADALLASLETGRFRILDARAAERYRGDVEPMDANAGHIPGAHNRPFRLNLRDDDTFKSPAQLHQEFAAALPGIPLDRVVHQCGSGISACQNVLAMAVASMPGTLLYPGSWSEWSSASDRPIATGDAP